MIYDELCKTLKTMSDDELKVIYRYVLDTKGGKTSEATTTKKSKKAAGKIESVQGEEDEDIFEVARKEREALTDEDVARDDQWLYDHADEILNDDYVRDPTTGEILVISTKKEFDEYFDKLMAGAI